MDSNDERHALDRIIYISLPADFERTVEGFQIDPSVLLPVELPPGAKEPNLQELSWEMIIAAMLKILAYRPADEHAGYYRSFILAVKPSIVEELAETAVIKARNSDYDIAEEIFKALNGLLPGNPGMTLNLALVYEQRADAYETLERTELADLYRTRAFSAYKQALILDDSSPEIHLNAGYFYLKQNNFEKAVEHLSYYMEEGSDQQKKSEIRRTLSELQSRNLLDRLFKEAYDYIRMGKEQDGIEKIREFLAKSPEVWNAWFLLGWGYRRLGQYREGKEAFLKALEYGTANPDILNELSICLMELGEFGESRTRLYAALKMEPENAKIISNLGILSLKERNFKDAEGFFRTVLEIDPDDPIAAKYLNFLENKDKE